MNKERLLAVAENVRKGGDKSHRLFDFSSFDEGDPDPERKNKCGTHGCALGDLPLLFPKAWRFKDGEPKLIGSKNNWPSDDAAEFFGISDDEVLLLFYPGTDEGKKFGEAVRLPKYASRSDVADNILRFIEWKDSRV